MNFSSCDTCKNWITTLLIQLLFLFVITASIPNNVLLIFRQWVWVLEDGTITMWLLPWQRACAHHCWTLGSSCICNLTGIQLPSIPLSHPRTSLTFTNVILTYMNRNYCCFFHHTTTSDCWTYRYNYQTFLQQAPYPFSPKSNGAKLIWLLTSGNNVESSIIFD